MATTRLAACSLALLTAGLASSTASSASSSAQPSIIVPRSEGAEKMDLFKNVFTQAQPKPDLNRRVVPVPEPTQPSVRCGMPVIAADPNIDPKMVHRPPAGVHFTMRIISPPVCGQQSPSKPLNSDQPDLKK